ncbi:MAG: tetratricopeptide repeat protein [Acidobacteria bacterium]|nr:tetratricopeptide repeat protein [Acidobacteriota bacterium]
MSNLNAKPIFTFRSLTAVFVVGLLSLFCLLACVSAQQATVESAEEELKAGKYSEAMASFNSLLQTAPKDERAQAGLLKAYLETGKYTEAETDAKKFLARGESPAARLALAEVMAITGRYTAAIAEFEKVSQITQKAIEKAEKEEKEKKPDANAEEKPEPIPSPKAQRVLADLRRAELLHLTGKEEQAKEIFESLVKYYEDNDVDSAEELTSIARTLSYLEKYQDAKDMYLEAIAADATYIEAQLGGGELFTSKYNYEEAATFFEDAKKINANSARLHLAIAANKRIGGGDEMYAELAEAQKINPNYVEAKIFAASLDLDGERHSAAAAQLDSALKINPNSLDAHSLRAAMFWLENKPAEFDSEVKTTLAINPRYGSLYETLGHFATQTRRYRESVAFLREAIKLTPNLYSSHLDLGMGLLRLGDFEEGRAEVELAFKGDPFNLWAKNTLDLLDTMNEYKVTKSGDFIVKIADKENDVLSGYATDLLTEVQATLTAKYKFTPRGPISVEVFPNHDDFAVRALGLPGLGALGVCFGQVIAQDSPSARPAGEFNWGTTMWHEYTHVITLQITDHLIPRWFSEGLSVFEEHKARPGWGDDWSINHIKAFADGRWFKISEIDNGFLRPKRPDDINLAYFEASQICHFVEDKYDFNAILDMLRGYKEKKKTPEILLSVLKLSEADFDREFNSYVSGKISGYVKALEPGWKNKDLAQMPKEEVIKQAEAQPDNFILNLRAGLELISDTKFDQAVKFLKRSIELFPFQSGDGNAYEALAHIYKQQGNKVAEAETLEALIKVDENDYDALKRLAQLKLEAGDKTRALELLKLGFYVNPFEPAAHATAGDLLLEVGGTNGGADKAIREFQIALAANPPNLAEAQYNLARAYFTAGKKPEARRFVLRSLENAPSFEKAQELLLKIRGQ